MSCEKEGLSANTFNIQGESDLDLHVSVTRGPSSPPTVNFYATSKADGELRFNIVLDLHHAQDLVEKLVGSCELIEEDVIMAGNSRVQ
jgi:hypothetical protein